VSVAKAADDNNIAQWDTPQHPMRILEPFSTWPFVVYQFILGVAILAGVAAGSFGCCALRAGTERPKTLNKTFANFSPFCFYWAMASDKIVITGAAGLLGQNLIPCLKLWGTSKIVAIDKHVANTATLRRLHPDITIIEADIARDDGWQSALTKTDVLVCAHAQINGTKQAPFENNNIFATRRLLEIARRERVGYLVHISSAAVHSKADNFYSQSKKSQETLVGIYDIPTVVLRPSLMFGRFDRKNLGWLARFMANSPIFPVPGDGRYPRQPLYVDDFCNIIRSCIERRIAGTYDISGLHKLNYIDLVRMIQRTLGLRTHIINIPYRIFWLLLKVYGLIDHNPPFTTDQLEALTTPDEFEIMDWPHIFDVIATPLDEAIKQTFHPQYAKITLEF
jgi:nucleoside-diphosphate-sugar epimerase